MIPKLENPKERRGMEGTGSGGPSTEFTGVDISAIKVDSPLITRMGRVDIQLGERNGDFGDPLVVCFAYPYRPVGVPSRTGSGETVVLSTERVHR